MGSIAGEAVVDASRAAGPGHVPVAGLPGEGLRIGVLAMQGAFAEHRRILERLGATVVEVAGAGAGAGAPNRRLIQPKNPPLEFEADAAGAGGRVAPAVAVPVT